MLILPAMLIDCYRRGICAIIDVVFSNYWNNFWGVRMRSILLHLELMGANIVLLDDFIRRVYVCVYDVEKLEKVSCNLSGRS